MLHVRVPPHSRLRLLQRLFAAAVLVVCSDSGLRSIRHFLIEVPARCISVFEGANPLGIIRPHTGIDAFGYNKVGLFGRVAYPFFAISTSSLPWVLIR